MTAMKFNRMIKVSGLALGLAFAASAGTAQATAFTAQQLLSSFNLISSGNVSTTSDIEGSAVVGGNLNGATFFNNDVPANPAVYLYGHITGGSNNFDNGGNLYYTGTGQTSFNGGKQIKSLPNSLSAYTTPLTQLSTQLGALAATAGTTVTNGNFNANGATGLVVFNLTAAQLTTDLYNADIKFTGAGVTGFIVNVTGNFSEASGVNFNTPQQDAIFNFTNATTVSLGNWKTSVLAPTATLSNSNYIAGSVFAASFNGNGELHNNNLYDGALPAATGAVPEAATWEMMLAGFAAVGFAMRSRREPVLALSYARI